jgi:hypothetical protein
MYERERGETFRDGSSGNCGLLLGRERLEALLLQLFDEIRFLLLAHHLRRAISAPIAHAHTNIYKYFSISIEQYKTMYQLVVDDHEDEAHAIADLLEIVPHSSEEEFLEKISVHMRHRREREKLWYLSLVVVLEAEVVELVQNLLG